jgi:hypothetical protein
MINVLFKFRGGRERSKRDEAVERAIAVAEG